MLVRRDELMHLRSHKLAYRWRRLYRIKSLDTNKSTYILEELDSAKLKRPIARRRLRAVPAFRYTASKLGKDRLELGSDKEDDIAYVNLPSIGKDERAEYEPFN